MTTNEYLDRQIIGIGLIVGIMGGGLMIYLSIADFGLYYMHSYLYFINYLLTMIIGLTVYKKVAKDNSTYLKRTITGFLIYSLTTICYLIYSTSFENFNLNRSLEEKVFGSLILIAIGLIFSLLLALFYKPRQLKNE
jgi:hypothetical protein